MKIGLLATGDELINGDILNTNGQKISQQLFDAGFEIGNHVAVSDVESEIISSIDFLKTQHNIIITTGGLGPTSDDRTRFALAKANNLELFFDEASWQNIVTRLNRYALKIHDSNRQQAYFPIGAEVLANPNGTAAGCKLELNNWLFFMLPGPPHECLPMFADYVLPYLIQYKQEKKYQQKKWRLIGVSEGEIAAELDVLAKDFAVSTGYRWDYPYLEFKLRYEANYDISSLINLIEQRIAPHCICTDVATASDLLIEKLKNISTPLIINDNATAGLLASRLTQPEIFNKLKFAATPEAHVIITGLDELWNNQSPQGQIKLQIKGNYNNKFIDATYSMPFRNRRVVEYAVEIIAAKLQELLSEKS